MKIVKKGLGVLTGLIAFVVYMLTVSRSVTAFDCGELAAVQATLGIAHPPGYPLFTLLGYLFDSIRIKGNLPIEYFMLNLVCCGSHIFHLHNPAYT